MGQNAVLLEALDEFRYRWDSVGFLQCLKKSVQDVPIHLQSSMRIWSRLSGQSNKHNQGSRKSPQSPC